MVCVKKTLPFEQVMLNLPPELGVGSFVEGDANACDESGIYYVTGQSLNLPNSDTPFVLVFKHSSFANFIFQFAFRAFQGNQVYYRGKLNNYWSTWREI